MLTEEEREESVPFSQFSEKIREQLVDDIARQIARGVLIRGVNSYREGIIGIQYESPPVEGHVEVSLWGALNLAKKEQLEVKSKEDK